MKTSVSDRIRELRIKRGLTQTRCATALGIKRAAFGHIEGGTNQIKSEHLEVLAALFGVSVDYLLGLTTIPTQAISIDVSESVPIPIVRTIRTSRDLLDLSAVQGWVQVSKQEAADGEYRYLRVTSDEMELANIKPGALVYVRLQEECNFSDIVLAVIDDGPTIMRRVVKAPDGYVLTPESDNPSHESYFYKPGISSVAIVGKLLHVRFEL